MAEHDLAHTAGFIASPRYMAAVRRAFARVGEKAASNPRVAAALESFDSVYSLRLYYAIEVFCEVPPRHHQLLQELVEIPIPDLGGTQRGPPTLVTKDEVEAFLIDKLRNDGPIACTRYLSNLYWHFHLIVDALGGESRDLLNRRRKFHRDGKQLGSFYDAVSSLGGSKFQRNSLFSIFLNANRALENKRSTHDDFERALRDIHSILIGCLIGTAQLTPEDWVLQSAEEEIDTNSPLYRYIHDTGLFNENHLLWQAICNPEYDKVLTGD